MSKKITNEIISNRILNILGEDYILKSNYKSKDEKILIEHIKCSTEYSIIPHTLINKNKKDYTCKCPYCFHHSGIKYTIKSLNKIINEILESENNEYEVLYYKSNKEKMLLKHSCGLEYQIRFNNIKKHKTKCPNCYSGFYNENFVNPRKSIDDIKNELELYNSEIILISKYRTNRNNGLQFKHTKCGYEFNTKSLKFKEIRCPLCKKRSKYEEKIRNILNKEKIHYEEQKTFDDCKNIQKLKFDFYLTDFNTIIEYDGIYHNSPIRGLEKLHKQQYLDKIKTDYCTNKKINLIRLNSDINILESELYNILMDIKSGKFNDYRKQKSE